MGHVRLYKQLLPFRGLPFFHNLLNQRHQLFPLGDPICVHEKAFVRGQIRALGAFTEVLPLAVIAHRQHDPAVLGGKELIRHNLQVGIALASGNSAAREIRLSQIDLGRDGAIEKGQVNRSHALFDGGLGDRQGSPRRHRGRSAHRSRPRRPCREVLRRAR